VLEPDLSPPARYQMPPTGVHKLLWYLVDLLIAQLECLPLCVCVTADSDQHNKLYTVQKHLLEQLIYYYHIDHWFYDTSFCFLFPFKEILKHGILNTAENFVNNTRMDGGFRKKKKLKKKEKKKTFYREQKKRLPLIVFLLCIKATDLFWQPKYDPVVDSIPI